MPRIRYVRELICRYDEYMNQAGVFAGSQRPLYEVKANLFKGLAHPIRVRVLEVLSAAADDVAVTELLGDTGLEASHLSQHLAVLRRHNLVVADRRGSQVFYRLAYPQVADLLAISRALLLAILEQTQHQLVSTIGLPELSATGSAQPLEP